MGITGELVKSVFSKSRSVGTQESNARSNLVDKRRWSAVRSYLCGDEFNSVLAEEDSASVRSSEATVTQPIVDDWTDKEDTQTEETIEEMTEEKQSSTTKQLWEEENAAIIIQSSFRGFLTRRRNEGIKPDSKKELVLGSPSMESVGTSLEVQTGHSIEVFSIRGESMAIHHRMQQKTRSQILKLKEDWDDSTVSSNISKMRIQNRLEATTRRERALAYAFSQQLRICSRKKQTRSDGTEPNMGWSWLERWMATRLPESHSVEYSITKQLEPITSNERTVVRKKLFDVAGEEESCGSNEVPVQIDSSSVTSSKEKYSHVPSKNRLKATRSTSRRKNVPSYQCPKDCTKVSKHDSPKKAEKEQHQKLKQLGSKREIKCKEPLSEVSPDLLTCDNIKWGP